MASALECAGRPLLFGGYPKSGTTLLTRLFDGHREVLVFPTESKFLTRLNLSRRRRTIDYLLNHSRLIRLRNPDLRVNWPEFSSSLRSLMADHPGRANILPAIMVAYAQSSGQSPCSYWAEKSALNELHFSTARKYWPELKTLYVVRDPRDVFVSYRKRRQRAGYDLTLKEFLRNWLHSVRSWDRFQARSSCENYLVKYEDLVVRPQEVLPQVCQHLQLVWDEVLLRPTQRGCTWGGNSMHDQVFTAISSATIGRHHDQLDATHRRCIELTLAASFERFGWPREHASSNDAPRSLLRLPSVMRVDRLSGLGGA